MLKLTIKREYAGCYNITYEDYIFHVDQISKRHWEIMYKHGDDQIELFDTSSTYAEAKAFIINFLMSEKFKL